MYCNLMSLIADGRRATMNKQQGQQLTTLKLALIGKIGVGKSKTGNTILDDKNAFKSGCQGSSLTKKCELRNCKRYGRQILLVDTPGLGDTSTKNNNVLKEIGRCVSLLTPGPHVFVLVLAVGRATNQDLEVIDLLKNHFGQNFFKHVVICITRFDDWKREKEDEDRNIHSINDFISSLPVKLREIVIKDCESRVVAFDNTLTGPVIETQVQSLLSVIDSALVRNEMKYYSFQDLRSSEEQNRKNEMEIQWERDRVLIENELHRQNKMLIEIRKEQHLKYKAHIRRLQEKRSLKNKILRQQQTLKQVKDVQVFVEIVGHGVSIAQTVFDIVSDII